MKQAFQVDPAMVDVARAIRDAGGRALLVGGWVRDRLLGRASKDHDFEVYGLPLDRLESVLGGFGEVIAVGRAFGVLMVKGLDADFSLPRRDSKVGRGHRGFRVDLDPDLDYATAALRRDITINTLGWDPLTHEILDPHGGVADLEARVLRATDAEKFGEDSLRGLRVAQFAARFEMQPDAELRRLTAALDLSDLPGERIFEEFRKLLLQARRPSLGFELMRETGLLRHFPELGAMVGVPQDPEWHPEGTVWTHTLMVVDEAAALRDGDLEGDLALMLGALCHDLGKPATTFEDEEGRIRSPAHDIEGMGIARALLGRLTAGHDLIRRVEGLVRFHLAPVRLVIDGASPRAYRRLARKLAESGLGARLLYRLAKADHLGRHTPEALARDFRWGDAFLRQMERLAIADAAEPDVVLGRHLLARGFTPGPWFGEILRACRDLQDATGWREAERILDRVLDQRGWRPEP